MSERLSTAQAIGALTAQIEAMNARLDREHQERQKLDRDAAAARVAVRDTLNTLEQGHSKIQERLDKIEPVTDMVTGWRARMVGAMMVLGFIGTIVWAGVLFFKDGIIKLLSGA